jgi:hypothetical protein
MIATRSKQSKRLIIAVLSIAGQSDFRGGHSDAIGHTLRLVRLSPLNGQAIAGSSITEADGSNPLNDRKASR